MRLSLRVRVRLRVRLRRVHKAIWKDPSLERKSQTMQVMLYATLIFTRCRFISKSTNYGKK